MTEGMFKLIFPPDFFDESAYLPTCDKYFWEPLIVEEED